MSAETFHRDMDLLRLSTAGSVDDGKSTLIGRLLYDTKSILEDQLAAIKEASERRGDDGLNLALLTDGLRAEREQNITIDVAYRYFATPKRKFIIADTPGHVQYTRNMVTGASTADLAIILVDARKGLLAQSKRHGFIASLLRIPHVLVAVNKMDLVDYSEAVFDRIVADYREFAEKLEVQDLTFIPISALTGANVVEPSDAMPWYAGSTMLHHLENVNVGANRNRIDFRFPVQQAIRPHQDFRGFAGTVASGSVSPGEEVIVLPAGRVSRVKSIETFDGPLKRAGAGEAVVLTLADDVDVGRGDMIVRRHNVPTISDRFDAMLCWLNEQPLDVDKRYVMLHTTRTTNAMVTNIGYRVDVETFRREPAVTLGLNDIGRVSLRVSGPLAFDAYAVNPVTGSFILVDPGTNATVAAGMIRGDLAHAGGTTDDRTSPDVVWEPWNVPREERARRNGHQPLVVWFTGLSGSGKSPIARAVERKLFADGRATMLLDGDQLRHGLSRDLGFALADRTENIRRAGETARLFFEHGDIVLCTFVSPLRADRERVKRLLPSGSFMEVFVRCPIEECARRDPKQLYARAAAGGVSEFTGVSSPYEEPESPELVLDSDQISVDESVARVIAALERTGIFSVHRAR